MSDKINKMEKLNSQLSIKLSKEEKIRIQNLADDLEVSLNYLVRSILNGMYDYIKYEGEDKVLFGQTKIIVTDKIKK